MTRRYAAAAAAAGDEVELLVLEGANHTDVVDPLGPAPAMTARAVSSLVNSGATLPALVWPLTFTGVNRPGFAGGSNS